MHRSAVLVNREGLLSLPPTILYSQYLLSPGFFVHHSLSSLAAAAAASRDESEQHDRHYGSSSVSSDPDLHALGLPPCSILEEAHDPRGGGCLEGLRHCGTQDPRGIPCLEEPSILHCGTSRSEDLEEVSILHSGDSCSKDLDFTTSAYLRLMGLPPHSSCSPEEPHLPQRSRCSGIGSAPRLAHALSFSSSSHSDFTPGLSDPIPVENTGEGSYNSCPNIGGSCPGGSRFNNTGRGYPGNIGIVYGSSPVLTSRCGSNC